MVHIKRFGEINEELVFDKDFKLNELTKIHNKLKNEKDNISRITKIKTSLGDNVGFSYKEDGEEIKVFFDDKDEEIKTEDHNKKVSKY